MYLVSQKRQLNASHINIRVQACVRLIVVTLSLTKDERVCGRPTSALPLLVNFINLNLLICVCLLNLFRC